MNKPGKIWIGIISVLICAMILGNVLYMHNEKDKNGRLYRVEATRIASELKNKSLSEIDISKYDTILFVEEYNPSKYCPEDYMVEEVNGKLFLIAYKEAKDKTILYIMNFSFIMMILVNIFLLLYVSNKILKPFENMSDLTASLAKGNLSTPLKQEKNKYFGEFIWGLDMLRENLEETKEKELDLQKEKKTLILSLSHDIRTPLSAIELYTKALETGLYDTKDKKQEAYLGIQKNANEIKNYVDQITKASKEDFLNLSVNVSEVYLSEIMDSTEKYYNEKLMIHHTDFIVKKYSDCLLKGDKERLIEVVQNVMENAIKYGDGSSIVISFSEEEDCKLIKITNSGNTLKEDELTHVFESFYRGTNGENIKGSGLGLYICKNIMKLMDGDIFARCEKNDFSVTIVIRKA